MIVLFSLLLSATIKEGTIIMSLPYLLGYMLQLLVCIWHPYKMTVATIQRWLL